MQIHERKNGTELILELDGRIDTMTAPELDNYLNGTLSGISSLILDFEKVSYISSAGLRVLLMAQKTMLKQGKMEIHNVNDMIQEIFEVTGFQEILTIR